MFWAKKAVPPEHPDTLRQFNALLAGLKWNPGEKRAELKLIFDAAINLADAELRYYYIKRKRKSRLSFWCRASGWIFGSAGIIIPLAASAHDSLKALTPWGFVCFAIAGCFYGLNSLFAGTHGHSSSTEAQLRIWKMMAEYSVLWSNFQAATDDEGRDTIEKGFVIIADFLKELFRVTDEETKTWKAEQTAVIEKLQNPARIS